jgi:hypothetical protein
VNYRKYGISPELVEQIKAKMKHPEIQQRVTEMVNGLTKAELQSPTKVKGLMERMTKLMGIRLSAAESRGIVQFVLDQKIDPNSTFHLIKLWGMFR